MNPDGKTHHYLRKSDTKKLKPESDQASRLPIYRNDTGQSNMLDNTVGAQYTKSRPMKKLSKTNDPTSSKKKFFNKNK